MKTRKDWFVGRTFGAAAVPAVIALASLWPTVGLAGDPKSAGDVVGRNTWAGGSTGHVGIYDGSNVMEMNDTSPPIRKITLTQFKKDHPISWGARYMPGCYNYCRVVDAGWQQRCYSPVYRLFGPWREGRYFASRTRVWDSSQKKYVYCQGIVPAWFRCDVFVCYAYEKGIGVKSLWGNGQQMGSWNIAGHLPGPETPRKVFFRLPSAR